MGAGSAISGAISGAISSTTSGTRAGAVVGTTFGSAAGTGSADTEGTADSTGITETGDDSGRANVCGTKTSSGMTLVSVASGTGGDGETFGAISGNVCLAGSVATVVAGAGSAAGFAVLIGVSGANGADTEVIAAGLEVAGDGKRMVALTGGVPGDDEVADDSGGAAGDVEGSADGNLGIGTVDEGGDVGIAASGTVVVGIGAGREGAIVAVTGRIVGDGGRELVAGSAAGAVVAGVVVSDAVVVEIVVADVILVDTAEVDPGAELAAAALDSATALASPARTSDDCNISNSSQPLNLFTVALPQQHERRRLADATMSVTVRQSQTEHRFWARRLELNRYPMGHRPLLH